MDTQTSRMAMWTQGMGGYGEIGVDKCTLPCVREIASGKLRYSIAWWSAMT